MDNVALDTVDLNSFSEKEWTVNAVVNNKNITLKLDSGASCNCMYNNK